jgi:hypothetical protein
MSDEYDQGLRSIEVKSYKNMEKGFKRLYNLKSNSEVGTIVDC